MTTAYRILDRLRAGEPLRDEDVRLAVAGAADGSWGDAELGALLMGLAIRGLGAGATHTLTRAMLESGESWDLGRDVPTLSDKHSTGGVADSVSLVLGPLLAACDRPVAMLTGRGLGHTGGTADKLESIPGLSLDLDRARCLRLLAEQGLAIGTSTPEIAPADRRLYALRDRTATIRSLPLITASILSKKLATGAAALVFDVKTGNGAFLSAPEAARELAGALVATVHRFGRAASALVTDMSQPLGEWAGHTAEVRGALEALAGDGAPDLVEVTLALAEEMAAAVGRPLDRAELTAAIASGRARERFDAWAVAQGADPAWMARPDLALAPVERVVEAPRSGVVARVATHQLGLLLAEAGGGRIGPAEIDPGVAFRYRVRLGQRVERGDELLRLYLRRDDDELVARFASAIELGERAEPPTLIGDRFG